MKNYILKLTGLLAVMFIAFQAKAQSDNELKTKIEKLNREMAAAMIAGDNAKSISFYTDDAISLPDHGKMVEGKVAMKAANDEMMKTGMKITSFETTTAKVMSSGKMVTEIGHYKMSITMPGKSDAITDSGKYLTIWEKQSDGSLKVKVEMWNTDTNPAGNM